MGRSREKGSREQAALSEAVKGKEGEKVDLNMALINWINDTLPLVNSGAVSKVQKDFAEFSVSIYKVVDLIRIDVKPHGS